MTLHRGPKARALLAGAFLVAYFASRRLGVDPVACEVMAVLPAAVSAALLFRGSRRESGASRTFLRLLGLCASTWALGQAAWAVALAIGAEPAVQRFGLLEVLFIGFTIPALAAGLLGPRPRSWPPGPRETLDLLLLAGGTGLVFLRLVFVPLAGFPGPRAFPSVLLASLCLSLGALSLARVVLGDDPMWRRRYVLLGAFAVSYGVGSALANGVGPMPPPGGPLDLAWFVPFFFLAAVPRAERRPLAPMDAATIVGAVGLLPLAVELAALLLWPASLDATGRELLVAGAVLLGLGGAARVRLEDERDDGVAGLAERERLEEERRSGRLESLASVARPLLADLRRAVDTLADRAADAEAALGAEAGSVRRQVDRALLLTAEIEGALRRPAAAPTLDIDAARLVETVLQAEVDAGLPLRVRVASSQGVPRVAGDTDGLAAAVRELARNAAQASPGGALEVQVDRDGGFVRLRFSDDGPGIPEEIRAQVFDPFFTTRRVGEGVGLGLTLVHFVSREARGSVRLEPAQGRGTSVVLRLPAAERRESRAAVRLLGIPVVATAALLTLVAADPGHAPDLARAACVAASALAALALLRLAPRDRGFIALLALGAALPGLACGLDRPALRLLAEVAWGAAVFVAAVDTEVLARSAVRRGVAAATLVLFVLVALGIAWVAWPRSVPFGLAALAGVSLRLLLASAAAAVAARETHVERGRALVGLAWALSLWSLAEVSGLWLARMTPLGDVPLADLAGVLPLLLLWAVARAERDPIAGALAERAA